jgi:TPP-dependent pyruvate/acetoin dehydrogenase alpha subunit
MTLDAELLTEMYRRMCRIRVFEERAIELQRKGEIPGALHTSLNQEAAVVGATLALRHDDYMTGTHRSHGHPIGKGAKIDRLMAELMGKVTGVCQENPASSPPRCRSPSAPASARNCAEPTRSASLSSVMALQTPVPSTSP